MRGAQQQAPRMAQMQPERGRTRQTGTGAALSNGDDVSAALEACKLRRNAHVGLALTSLARCEGEFWASFGRGNTRAVREWGLPVGEVPGERSSLGLAFQAGRPGVAACEAGEAALGGDGPEGDPAGGDAAGVAEVRMGASEGRPLRSDCLRSSRLTAVGRRGLLARAAQRTRVRARPGTCTGQRKYNRGSDARTAGVATLRDGAYGGHRGLSRTGGGGPYRGRGSSWGATSASRRCAGRRPYLQARREQARSEGEPQGGKAQGGCEGAGDQTRMTNAAQQRDYVAGH